MVSISYLTYYQCQAAVEPIFFNYAEIGERFTPGDEGIKNINIMFNHRYRHYTNSETSFQFSQSRAFRFFLLHTF
jgi:hypothetical protein